MSHRPLLQLLLATPALLSLSHVHAAEKATPAASTPAKSATAKSAATKQKPADTPATTPTNAGQAAVQAVEIKGAAATYDARRYDTATKIVVTQEEILKNGDTSMGEVLKRLPGITVNNGIRMRGLGGGYTQILLNGEPSPPGFSLESVSPDMVERVEIIRAATAEFSTQAIAGTINIVLKKAIQTAQKELKVGMQYDGGHPGLNVNFQSSDKVGAASYAVGGGTGLGNYARPSSNFERLTNAAGVVTRLRTGVQEFGGRYQFLNLSPRVNWTINPFDTLTSQSFINFNRNSGFYDRSTTTQLGVPPPFIRGRFDNESTFMALRTDVNWLHKLDAGAKLDVKAGVNYNHNDSSNIGTQYDPDNKLALNSLSTSGGSDKGLTASGKLTTPYLEDHALAFGWDGSLSNRGETRVEAQSTAVGYKPILDTMGKPLYNVTPENLNEGYDASVRRLALFAQDEWNINQQWSMYVGLRWEGIATTAGATGFADIKNSSSVWSPLFQTLWKLPDSKGDQVRFALTRTYKAPSTYSLVPRSYVSRDNSKTSPDYRGNPNLKPELAWGLDLGVEHYIDGGGILSASTFVRRIEDITRQQIDESVVLKDGQYVPYYVAMTGNGGTANTHGIEMDAKLPLRSVWKTAPGIDLRANFTRTWSTLSTVPGPNNRLGSQTPFSGTVGVDYKMDGGPVSAGGNFSFQSAGQVRTSVTQFAYSVPRRSLDMYAAWKFNPKNQVRLSINNALHQDGFSENTYADAKETAVTGNVSPSTTTVRAMLEMKL